MEPLEQQIASLAAAVAQLDLALRESETPAREAGESLTRLSAGIERIRTAAATDGPMDSLLDDCRLAQLDLGACLENLQFYDRMNQHLSHVRDFMSGMTVAMAGMGDHENLEAWERLRVKLRQRLISQAQRDLLDLILRPAETEFTPRAQRQKHADPGSVELF